LALLLLETSRSAPASNCFDARQSKARRGGDVDVPLNGVRRGSRDARGGRSQSKHLARRRATA
jgi:hypothetical protein